MEKIHVGLYGGKSIFGGKETPLRAEVVYCDKYDNCSLYKSGYCLNVTDIGSCKCKFGRINKIQGYTSRAKKYYDFKRTYDNDEKRSKLKYPSNTMIAILDDLIYINVSFAKLKYEDGMYEVTEPCFSSTAEFIPREYFNTNLLYRICKFRPQALMGGEISGYQKEKIPDFLIQLRRAMPNLYNDFIKEYPEFNITPNYIGKYVYIKTMTKDSILYDCHGNRFVFDGEYLICEKWKLSFVPFDGDVAYMKIKVTDKMKYKIDDNLQVNEDTVFVQ